jgi:PGF-CTERM protein
MNRYNGKVTWNVSIPVSLMCIISLVTFITPVHAAVGDLILDSEILLRTPVLHDAKKDTGSTTLLKDGYSLSLDKVWWGGQIGVADFSIFENGEVVKRLSANEEDYFYYNKTIDGKEYTIIESKVEVILWGNYHLVKLRPVRQYSDGSVISEPDFITASLNPYTNETPPEEWNVTFGGLYGDIGHSVVQTRDDGYIFIGSKRSYTPGMDMNTRHAWLIKTDTNGIEQWNKTFENIDLKKAYSVLQTDDGGYIFADDKGSSETGYNARLVKTDANGSEQWNRTIGPGLMATISSICQTLDGGYVLAGKIDTAKNPEFQGQILYSNDDAWLFKIDASGNLKWSKTFGGLRNDEARFAQQTSDGGYIIAGTTESYGAGSSDLWLVKVAGMEVDAAQSGARLSDDNFTENLQGGIPSEPEGGDIRTDEEPVQTPDVPGFGSVVAVIGLLVWVYLGGRRL